jgi:hypothetical protein
MLIEAQYHSLFNYYVKQPGLTVQKWRRNAQIRGKKRWRRDDPVEEGQPIWRRGRAPTPAGQLGYRRVEVEGECQFTVGR